MVTTTVFPCIYITVPGTLQHDQRDRHLDLEIKPPPPPQSLNRRAALAARVGPAAAGVRRGIFSRVPGFGLRRLMGSNNKTQAEDDSSDDDYSDRDYESDHPRVALEEATKRLLVEVGGDREETVLAAAQLPQDVSARVQPLAHASSSPSVSSSSLASISSTSGAQDEMSAAFSMSPGIKKRVAARAAVVAEIDCASGEEDWGRSEGGNEEREENEEQEKENEGETQEDLEVKQEDSVAMSSFHDAPPLPQQQQQQLESLAVQTDAVAEATGTEEEDEEEKEGQEAPTETTIAMKWKAAGEKKRAAVQEHRAQIRRQRAARRAADGGSGGPPMGSSMIMKSVRQQWEKREEVKRRWRRWQRWRRGWWGWPSKIGDGCGNPEREEIIKVVCALSRPPCDDNAEVGSNRHQQNQIVILWP